MDMVKDLLSNNIIYGQTSYDWMLICVTIFSLWKKKFVSVNRHPLSINLSKFIYIHTYTLINKVLVYG